MNFEPENPLEEALVRAAADAPARPEFFRRVMDESLFVPGALHRMPDIGSVAHLLPNDKFDIAIVRHAGRNYHPVFTSLTRLKTFAPKEERYFTTAGRDLFSRTRGADFMLNPKSEFGKLLMAGEIAFLLDPAAGRPQSAPPQVFLHNPETYPRMLVEALKVLFANRREIVTAYLTEVAFSDRSEPPHPLIAVETEGRWGKTFWEVSELATALMPEMLFDVVPFDRAQAGAGVMAAIANTIPFYTRQPTE